MVDQMGELLFMLRVILIMLGCLCGFLSALMVFLFIKYRDLL